MRYMSKCGAEIRIFSITLPSAFLVYFQYLLYCSSFCLPCLFQYMLYYFAFYLPCLFQYYSATLPSTFLVVFSTCSFPHSLFIFSACSFPHSLFIFSACSFPLSLFIFSACSFPLSLFIFSACSITLPSVFRVYFVDKHETYTCSVSTFKNKLQSM